MKKIIFIPVFILSTMVFAQRGVPQPPMGGAAIFRDPVPQNIAAGKQYNFYGRPGTSLSAIPDGVEGSPYYDKEFRAATITGTDLKILARYNSFSDEIEFLKESDMLVVTKEKPYLEFVFSGSGEKIFLIKDQYYFEKFDGKDFKLYKKIQTKFRDATNVYSESKPARFYSVPDKYYIYQKDNLVEVPRKAKNFVELFPPKKTEILQFLKKNNNKLETETEIKAVLSFVNQ